MWAKIFRNLILGIQAMQTTVKRILMAHRVAWKCTQNLSFGHNLWQTVGCGTHPCLWWWCKEASVLEWEESLLRWHCQWKISMCETAIRNKIKKWIDKGVTELKQWNLTEALISKLQNFWRREIVYNAPDVKEMKTSVLETLFHCMSTDNKPNAFKMPFRRSFMVFL